MSRRMVARQGRIPLYLLLLLGTGLAYAVGFAASIPAWLLCGVVLFLFRDPARQTPAIPLAVISPVSGTVLGIEELVDPWLQRPAKKVHLLMGALDIFALHSPIEGKVMKQWYAKAGSMPAEERHQSAHWIRTDEQDDVVFVVATRHLISRLRCGLIAGHRIGQGQGCGVILFGAEVEVWLASNSRLKVDVGDKVIAGSSILGELVHNDENINGQVPAI